ncbi:hypothetical protein F4804DRAFT_298118 [Jackrogersella minutella]|nr:hypothetical protein F4804DRAFT_298118 [Jackrogersella minutella]
MWRRMALPFYRRLVRARLILHTYVCTHALSCKIFHVCPGDSRWLGTIGCSIRLATDVVKSASRRHKLKKMLLETESKCWKFQIKL